MADFSTGWSGAQLPGINSYSYANPGKAPTAPRFFEYGAGYQQALDQYNKDLAAYNAQLTNAGLNPDGSPKSPQFSSLVDPSTGRLKQQYSITEQLLDPGSIAGYSQYKDFATGTGPSAYATAAENQLNLKTAIERDKAMKDAATGAAAARSSLAMRGGMTSGARERLGKTNYADLQGVRRNQMVGLTDILTQDAGARQGALKDFTTLGANIGQFNTNLKNQAQEFNVRSALEEINRGREFEMSRYKQESEKWAADKKSQAQAAAACFPKGVKVTMNDGTKKNIEDIRVGDVVALGGRVYALYSQDYSDHSLFNYRGVAVAGSHPVLDIGGKWTRVKDSPHATLSDVRADVVYDFSCEKHLVLINDIMFSDFAESDDFYLSEEESIEKLNEQFVQTVS